MCEGKGQLVQWVQWVQLVQWMDEWMEQPDRFQGAGGLATCQVSREGENAALKPCAEALR
ncbi:MAG: hypothetical protein GXO86_13355 [Chlorobi bacterium]|nr:hypothetical protein [Chlorobiota bacterium]